MALEDCYEPHDFCYIWDRFRFMCHFFMVKENMPSINLTSKPQRVHFCFLGVVSRAKGRKRQRSVR